MILHITPKSIEMAMKRTPSVPGLVPPPCDADEDEEAAKNEAAAEAA